MALNPYDMGVLLVFNRIIIDWYIMLNNYSIF